jgi:hypothetical protein
MGILRDRFDALIGLGPSDNPRPVAVGRVRRVVERPVMSTPGARIRIRRDGRDGDIGRLVLMCHRRGVAMELSEGENAVFLDGAPIAAMALAERIRGGLR